MLSWWSSICLLVFKRKQAYSKKDPEEELVSAAFGSEADLLRPISIEPTWRLRPIALPARAVALVVTFLVALLLGFATWPLAVLVIRAGPSRWLSWWHVNLYAAGVLSVLRPLVRSPGSIQFLRPYDTRRLDPHLDFGEIIVEALDGLFTGT